MRLTFLYPESGYFFYKSEEPVIRVRVENNGTRIFFSALIRDYEEKDVGNFETRLENVYDTVVSIPLKCERLGYYNMTVTARGEAGTVVKSTGIGITTEYTAVPAEQSKFGLNINTSRFTEPPFAAAAKMGILMIRRPVPAEAIPYADTLKKYGIKTLAQWGGRPIIQGCCSPTAQPDRYAPPEFNSAYYAEKLCSDYVIMYEFGNEFAEEHNLTLSAEWHKDTGLARLTANPKGWYSVTGLPGVDINKLEEYYEQGVLDYVTFLGIHPYSFPNAPENPYCYWSVKRLEDLAKWMDERGIKMPIAATEFGYPALKDQESCEVYSPGDMLTPEGQTDYIIRSWLIFISYGVANAQLYHGSWMDGFGIMEKDGPAPWPAAMALCELVRQVDRSQYVGNLIDEDDSNFYFLVFRKPTGRLFAVVWRVIYFSRSVEKHKNFAVDRSGAVEADGTVKELYDYNLRYTVPDYKIRDIMGNTVQCRENVIKIGERPIYIDGISEEILPLLTDNTIFETKTVIEKPLPSKVILGIQDEFPRDGAYATSGFSWGEKRTYLLRIHNYENEELNDFAILELPDGLHAENIRIPVCVPAKQILQLRVVITCDVIADCGLKKIKMTMEKAAAAPAVQNVEITYPVRVLPLYGALKDGSTVEAEFSCLSKSPVTYRVTFNNPQADVYCDANEFTLLPGERKRLSVRFGKGKYPVTATLAADISAEGKSARCELAIPLHYIEEKADGGMPDGSMNIIAGYNLQSTYGDSNPTGSLLGIAKPVPMTAYSKLWMDDKYLHALFDVKDDCVVCAKLGRRNNIDCDGVWLRLYRNENDDKPYRHFCMMPVDQCGRTDGAAVDEIAGDVLFAEKYSDYDLSKVKVSCKLYEEGYRLRVDIRRDSIELYENTDCVIADIRVINMNTNDWPLFYDTGKIVYRVIK